MCLNGENIFILIKKSAVILFIYWAELMNWSKNELQELVKLEKKLTTCGKFHPKSNVESRQEGGFTEGKQSWIICYE